MRNKKKKRIKKEKKKNRKKERKTWLHHLISYDTLFVLGTTLRLKTEVFGKNRCSDLTPFNPIKFVEQHRMHPE